MAVLIQALMLHLFACLVAPGLAINVALERKGGAEVPVSLLRGGVATSLRAFMVAEADAEMGSDLGLDLGLEQESSRGTSDPSTLAEYCAGSSEPVLGEGTRVNADWNGYGTKYPGKISDTNEDGTVDIAYNDGFTEKGVDPEDIKIRKKQKQSIVLLQAKGKPDDPACKMQDFLKKLQDGLKDVNAMVTKWLSGQRAKIANKDAPPAPPPVVTINHGSEAKVDGSTPPPTTDQAGKLEKLKKELVDLDAYIKELESEEEKYDKELQEKKNPKGANASAPGGVKTVDDLIAEYEAKVAERNGRVQELLKRIKEQKEELAKLAKGQLSLKDIDEAVKKLEQDVEEGKKKRDELKKSGELDPELRAIIDSIIKSLSKTRKKVDNLLALEAKAKAEEAKAEQEAKEAAEAARKKARQEGKDEDEAAAEAEASARKRSKERSNKADLETMEAANEVSKDLKDAEKGATKLDTGLHPHGERWWRYRYEHSYIEAVLMIFISFLMLCWSELWRHAKHTVNRWALAPGETPMTEIEELQEETHGTIYVCWLHYLADQMLVCIFTFLTLWLIAKTPLVEIFPYIIRPSEDMHVPNGPHAVAEYRHLALDICTIFFFAIVFYFGLMFAVAHEMTQTSTEMSLMDSSPRGGDMDSTPSEPMSSRATLKKSIAKHTMGSICGTEEQFQRIQTKFATVMNHKMAVHKEDQDLNEVSRLISDDFANFPLSKYLQMCIRAVGVDLFKFSWTMWIPVIGLFMCLMLLHRFAHMGYVRIMGVAAVLVLMMIICMGYVTKTIVRKCHEENTQELAQEEQNKSHKKTVHESFNTEALFLGMLQFNLFFVCYGVARMICQPWMWELHFWAVFSLTIVAIVNAIIFVLVVAPGIPSFICAMCLPPNVDPSNMMMMKQVALGMKQDAPTPRRRPSVSRGSN